MDDGWGWSDDDEFEEDPAEDLENALDDCGYDPTYKGICWHIGSEDCYFCPFHAIYFGGAGSEG